MHANKVADKLLAEGTRRKEEKAHSATAKKAKKQTVPLGNIASLPNGAPQSENSANHSADKPSASVTTADAAAGSSVDAPAVESGASVTSKVTKVSKKQQKAGAKALRAQSTYAQQGTKQTPPDLDAASISGLRSLRDPGMIGAVPAQHEQ